MDSNLGQTLNNALMKNSIILILFICLSCLTSLTKAQGQTDIVLANKYYDLGDSLKNITHYSLSIIQFEKASELYEKHGLWEKYAISICGIADNYFQKNDSDTGLKITQGALRKCQKYLDAESRGIADLWHELGKLYTSNSESKLAREALIKSLEIKETIYNKPNFSIGESYNSLGLYYRSIRSTDSSKLYFKKGLSLEYSSQQDKNRIIPILYRNLTRTLNDNGESEISFGYISKAFDIQIKNNGMENALGIGIYSDLAITYFLKEDFENALLNYNKCLELIYSLSSENKALESGCYTNMGLLHLTLGNYNLSLEYQKKALQLSYELKDNWFTSFAIHHNLGLAYSDINNLNKAIEHFNKSKLTLENILGKGHYESSQAYYGMARAYYLSGNLDSAEFFYSKSLKIRIDAIGENDGLVSIVLRDLGKISREKKNLIKAFDYVSRALRIQLNNGGEATNINTIYNYQELGEIFRTSKEYSKALDYFQLALINNSLKFKSKDYYTNPSLEGISDPEFLLRSLISNKI